MAHTPDTIKSQMNKLISDSNNKLGSSHSNLTDAVGDLIDHVGQGEYNVSSILNGDGTQTLNILKAQGGSGGGGGGYGFPDAELVWHNTETNQLDTLFDPSTIALTTTQQSICPSATSTSYVLDNPITLKERECICISLVEVVLVPKNNSYAKPFVHKSFDDYVYFGLYAGDTKSTKGKYSSIGYVSSLYEKVDGAVDSYSASYGVYASGSYANPQMTNTNYETAFVRSVSFARPGLYARSNATYFNADAWQDIDFSASYIKCDGYLFAVPAKQLDASPLSIITHRRFDADGYEGKSVADRIQGKL